MDAPDHVRTLLPGPTQLAAVTCAGVVADGPPLAAAIVFVLQAAKPGFFPGDVVKNGAVVRAHFAVALSPGPLFKGLLLGLEARQGEVHVRA